MKIRALILSLLLYICLPAAIPAQSPTKTFDQNGLKFEYPAEWVLVDKSSKKMQHLLLSKNNTSILIVIISPRNPIQTREQFSEVQRDAYEGYLKAIEKSLSEAGSPAARENLCLNFNGRNVSGVKLTGIYDNQPTTGEFYPFILGSRFLTLVYMRTDKDNTQGDAIWRETIKSLSLEGSNREAVGLSFDSVAVDKGVLNGEARKLPTPLYPLAAQATRSSGSVVVRVRVSEQGDVISAEAISGNSTFAGEAVKAAKKAKFTPMMLCDKPVQMTGTIVYNFIANRRY